jgi:hypothetical protein
MTSFLTSTSFDIPTTIWVWYYMVCILFCHLRPPITGIYACLIITVFVYQLFIHPPMSHISFIHPIFLQ